MIKQKPERDTAVTLNDWIDYIQSEYGAAPEHPWADEPEFAVFRHESNRKWFALVMNIRRDRLLPGEDGNIDVVNVKCDPILTGSVRDGRTIFSAYHMNKNLWISIILDKETDSETVKNLVGLSYELTAGSKK